MMGQVGLLVLGWVVGQCLHNRGGMHDGNPCGPDGNPLMPCIFIEKGKALEPLKYGLQNLTAVFGGCIVQVGHSTG
jgi:hypothetical protein